MVSCPCYSGMQRFPIVPNLTPDVVGGEEKGQDQEDKKGSVQRSVLSLVEDQTVLTAIQNKLRHAAGKRIIIIHLTQNLR